MIVYGIPTECDAEELAHPFALYKSYTAAFELATYTDYRADL